MSTALSINDPSNKAVRTSKTPANAEIINARPNIDHELDSAQQKNAKIVLGGGPEAG